MKKGDKQQVDCALYSRVIIIQFYIHPEHVKHSDTKQQNILYKKNFQKQFNPTIKIHRVLYYMKLKVYIYIQVYVKVRTL